MAGKVRQHSAIIMILLFFSLCECSNADVVMTVAQRIITENIDDALPEGWHIFAVTPESIPANHYWGMNDYQGQKGVHLALLGREDVFFEYMDKGGNWNQEQIAKEKLELWIMPPEYRESWRRFFVFKRPVPAKLIFNNEQVKIYAYLSHHIVKEERFRYLLTIAKSTSWRNSPSNTQIISWESWHEDLLDAFETQL